MNRKGEASLAPSFEFNLFDFAERIRPLLWGIEGLVIMADDQMTADAAQRADAGDEQLE